MWLARERLPSGGTSGAIYVESKIRASRSDPFPCGVEESWEIGLAELEDCRKCDPP
jgi:hypothetical protein